MKRDEGQCENNLGEKMVLDPNHVVVCPQTTLTLYMFFYNHIVIGFKKFFFKPYGFKSQFLLRRLPILEQQLEGGTPKPSISKHQAER